MNAAVALHTAARRYCSDRYASWCERYSEIVRRGGDREQNGSGYTSQALATFPRYNLLRAIRIELERIDPVGLSDFETTKRLLLRIGETADDDFTRHPIGQIDRQVMAEEREAFCSYLSELRPRDLAGVQILPYRRVLAAEESKTIWSRLRNRWQISEGYWYPLADCALPDVAAFRAAAFEEAVPAQRLQRLLAARGVRRVWELREYGPEYEQDVSLFEPLYNGAEGSWCSEGLDWIVYASHESSVTVAGWLLQEVRATWPSSQEHIWTGAY